MGIYIGNNQKVSAVYIGTSKVSKIYIGTSLVYSGNIIASGSCGTNLTWTLYRDGSLIIEGRGAMSNYATSSSPPWYNYRSSITSITFPDGMTQVGQYAFAATYYSGVTSVTIPSSVTLLGKYAFSGCDKLRTMTVKPTSPPSLQTQALPASSAFSTIYVPTSKVSTYKAASGWSSYSSKIRGGA